MENAAFCWRPLFSTRRVHSVTECVRCAALVSEDEREDLVYTCRGLGFDGAHGFCSSVSLGKGTRFP